MTAERKQERKQDDRTAAERPASDSNASDSKKNSLLPAGNANPSPDHEPETPARTSAA